MTIIASPHQDRTAPLTLNRQVEAAPLRCTRCGTGTDLTQVCAPCADHLCPDCYGPWTALACTRCRFTGMTQVALFDTNPAA